MKVLVTGANGYIGRTLIRALSEIHEVTGVNRTTFSLLDAESMRKWFDDKYFDVVIHTAIDGGSRLRTDKFSVMDNNLRMYYNLLEHTDHFSRFVSIGSGAELYLQNTPYGMSKHVIRHSMLEKDNFYNVRVFAVFDENELETRFIKANILRYIRKEQMVIHQNKLMDFFYMEDFVQVMKQYVSDVAPPKEFDCCYNEHPQLLEIAQYINTLSDYKVDIVFQTNKNQSPYTGKFTNIDLPLIGLHDGIKNVYNRLLCKI